VSTDADKARLEALEKRIAAAKAAQEPAARLKADGHRQAQLAWRMVIELVAGLMIGFGIGYGLDTLLGTMPVFLILFILAGFAAGVKTMLASAKEAQDKVAAAAETDKIKAADPAGGQEED
jgi:ATP synthase protein I